MTKKALVTGGCGFIGVHSCLRLLKEGWEVWALDDLSRVGTEKHLTELKVHPGFQFVKADIRDFAAVSKLVAHEKPDFILHLAAQVAVTTSVTDPRTDMEINVLGTFNLLEAVRKAGGSYKPFIAYASTNKVYGKLGDLQIFQGDTAVHAGRGWKGVDENAQLDFYSPYGCSKGAADQYVRDYARLYAMDTVVLRQSCIYGPKQMGIEDQGWVAWFAIALMQGKPITIYGNGKQVRDLLYVEDLVDLYMRCYERRDSVRGRVFNVGGGAGNALSLLEYLSYLKECGLPSQPKFSEMRPGDQWIFVSNNGALKKAVGWEPRTGWKQGIQNMLDSLAEQNGIARKKAA